MIINNNAKINTIKVDMPIEYKEKIEKIPEIEEQLANKSEINHTHDYSSISNTPSIPTKVGDLTNDQNYASKAYVESRIANITTGGEIDLSYYATIDMLSAKVDKENGKELINTEKIEKLDTIEDHANNYHHPATHAAEMIDESYERRFVSTDDLFTWNKKSNFSGNYSDLEGKPEIPTKTSQLENDSSFATTTQLATKAEKSHVHNYSEIEDTPNLFSGAYADLTGKPTIPKVISQLENDLNFVNITQLNTKADKVHTHSYNNLEDLPTLFSGNYNDLLNKPTVPSKTSELTNDSSFTTSTQLATKADKIHTHNYNDLEDKPTLFSGAYKDLTEKPTIPTKISELINDSNFVDSTVLSTKANAVHTHNYDDLTNKPVLFSGTYADLTGKPTIPTKTSELTNDSNFATVTLLDSKADKVHNHSYTELDDLPTLFSGDYKDLIGTPVIPSKTSELTNDSNFATTDLVNTKANKTHSHSYLDLEDLPNLFSGNYNDLLNKPKIPTLISELENDNNYVNQAYVEQRITDVATSGEIDLSDYVTTAQLNTKADKVHTHSYEDLTEKPTLFSGKYADLIGKPTIPTKTSDITNDSNFVTTSQLNTKADTIHTHSYEDLTDKPTLFSGKYADLTGKPTIPTKVSELTNDSSFATTVQLSTKANTVHTHDYADLENKPILFSGKYIDLLDKPTIPSKTSELTNDSNFVDTIALATKANLTHSHSYSDLEDKPILFSGAYKDLTGKPTIPTKISELTNDSSFATTSQLNTELNKKANTSHTHVYSDILDAPVSFSGNYEDLINKPTIPTKVSDLENDENFATTSQLNSGLNTKANSTHTHSYAELEDLPTLFSGNYNDLLNKPTVPSKTSELTNDSSFTTSTQLATKADKIHTHNYNDLEDKPTLFSGAYKDLTEKPTIPTKISELINDSNFVDSTVLSTKANAVHTHNYDDLTNKPVLFSGTYADLTGKPTIPTKTSELTNDSNFATVTLLDSKADKVHNHSYTELDDLPTLFSGDYKDLIGTPVIPSKTSELTNDSNFATTDLVNTKANKTHSHSYLDLEDLPNLFSGNYNDLLNKPKIPTLISELENDNNYVNQAYVEQRITDVATSGEIDLSDYVTTAQLNTKADKVHTHSYEDLTEKPTLFSGKYADLIGKPTIPTKTSDITNDSNFVTTSQLNTKADTIHTHSYEDLTDKPTLFSGKYADLTGKPTIPTKVSELTNDSSFATTVQLSTKANTVHTHDYADLENKPILFSGKYIDLLDKPTIPSKTSELTNDSNFVDTIALATKANLTHSHSYSDLEDKPILFSGAYKDLTGKPTIPTKISELTNDSSFATTSQLNTELNKKANTSHTHVYSDILDAPVSFSGNYEDLINKPTIPTKVSDLENDENFATTSQLNSGLNTKANSTHTHSYTELEDTPTLFSGNYNDLLNKPTIPTAVSDLTNDLNFVDTTALATKSDKTHTHSYSSLTDLPTLKTRVSDMDDATNYMTITQITTELNKKANTSHTHTFDDLNGFFYDGDTTNIIIPTKLGQLNNDMNFATKSYVDEQISNIDISAGNIGDTSLFATKSDLNYKVDKIEGKGLSTNDFTDSYRLKLDGLTNFNDSEINQKYNNLISLVNIPYNSDTNSVQLTTDRYQYISNFAKNITINLPKVTTFTEIVLFFIPMDSFYLDMPTVTFNRNIVSMKRGSYYRMTFTYVNAQMGWISDVPTFIL